MISQQLEKLQKWFLMHCDGNWEHHYGIAIETLDNPGWFFEVNFRGTILEEKIFQEVDFTRSELDWVKCRVKNERFEGFGGPLNLEEIIEIFLEWAHKASEEVERT